MFLKLESTTVLKKLFVIGGSLLSKQDFTYPEDDDVENSVVCLPRALHCMAGCMLFFYYYFLCTPNSSDWNSFISDWRKLIHVGAIDCAEERNLQTCINYEIEGYPTVKVRATWQHFFRKEHFQTCHLSNLTSLDLNSVRWVSHSYLSDFT